MLVTAFLLYGVEYRESSTVRGHTSSLKLPRQADPSESSGEAIATVLGGPRTVLYNYWSYGV